MRAISPRSLLLALLGAACARPQSTDGHAELEVQWNGLNSGRMEGSAAGAWCAYRKVLQIELVQGDSGIALALYPKDALGAGVYPVVDPVRAASTPPAAGVAVRWLAQTTVQGFRGDSGRVNLERSATGRLSGQIHARARSVIDTQTIRLRGTFRNLPLMEDTLGCAPADTAETPDEDIDSDDAGSDETGVD